MYRAAPIVLLLAVGCARSQPAEVAEQTTVEIPEAKPDMPKQEEEEDDVPVPSSPDRGSSPAVEVDPPEEEMVLPEPPGGLPPPVFGGSYAGPTGGPDCQALADCCLKSLGFVGGAPDPRMCQSMLSFPASLCAQVLPQLRQEALKHGVACGP
jgi:hypothetical protein